MGKKNRPRDFKYRANASPLFLRREGRAEGGKASLKRKKEGVKYHSKTYKGCRGQDADPFG